MFLEWIRTVVPKVTMTPLYNILYACRHDRRQISVSLFGRAFFRIIFKIVKELL